MDKKLTWTRREFVQAGLASTAGLLLVACGANEEAETAVPNTLPPTPACADDDDPTPPQTAGPFYTPDSPKKANFREDGPGTALLLTGQVLDANCQPIAGAMLDFWHANDDGEYDNAGYHFRGHQFADENGRYQLETILPGLYPGRTRHIHVRAQQPHGDILTTQLYFARERRNDQDGLFLPELIAADVETADGNRHVTFDFVLAG